MLWRRFLSGDLGGGVDLLGRRLLAVVGGQPLGAHVFGLTPGREVEAALLEAGARGVGGRGNEEAEAVVLADEHRRQLLKERAVGLGGPRDLERGPEVDVHEDALRRSAVGGGGEEHVEVRVLAGGVGGGFVPAGDADGGVVASGAERGGDQAEEVAPARARRAVALQVGADVGEEVALPERGAVDEALDRFGDVVGRRGVILILVVGVITSVEAVAAPPAVPGLLGARAAAVLQEAAHHTVQAHRTGLRLILLSR